MSETNKNDNEWKQRELGALWRRSGKSQKYLSGYIKVGNELEEKEVRLIVFTNKYKSENEKAPDFVIYESTPMEGQASPAVSSKQQSQPAQSEEVEEDLAELLK